MFFQKIKFYKVYTKYNRLIQKYYEDYRSSAYIYKI